MSCTGSWQGWGGGEDGAREGKRREGGDGVSGVEVGGGGGDGWQEEALLRAGTSMTDGVVRDLAGNAAFLFPPVDG